MDHVLDLIGPALERAAARRAAGELLGADPEERLRTLLGEELCSTTLTVEHEWEPTAPMQNWPQVGRGKLGGFDLAILEPGRELPLAVIETKWSKWGLIDALDEAPWDLFKVANAIATLPVTYGLMVYAAKVRAWDRPPRFVSLFDGEAEIDTREVIEDFPAVWEWNRRYSAKSGPVWLPRTISTQFLCESSLDVDGVEWIIKATRILSSSVEGYPV